MARSAGVTVIAVFAVLGSLLCFAMGCLMVVALLVGLPKQSVDAAAQGAAKLGMVMGMLVFLIPAIWGGVSSIGLFRMKRWARISTLIFAGLLAFFGVVSPIFILMIPMPATPGADPAVMAGVKVGITVFYLMLAAVGVWWLVYLTRPKVKAQFEVGFVPGAPSRRPLSVSIIGWFLIVSAAFLPINVILHVPVLMFGRVFTGWAAILLMTLLTIVSVVAGIGLLRLQLYGHRLALAFFVFGILNAATSYLLPGSAAKFAQLIDAMPSAFRHGTPPAINLVAIAIMMIAVILVPVFFLLKNRGAFEPESPMPAAPPSATI